MVPPHEESSRMSSLLSIVAAMALWRRFRNSFQPRSRWGKSVRETWTELAICASESAIWLDLLFVLSLHSDLLDNATLLGNEDPFRMISSCLALLLSQQSAFTLALIGSLWTLADVDQDTFFDTLRRVLGVYFCFTLLGQSSVQFFDSRDLDLAHTCLVQVCSLLTLAYRVQSGMGIADKKAAWGIDASPAIPINESRKLNILVLSIGTRGDVQPFIFLGTEMQSRGHTVTICALERYRPLVERHGMQFRSAGIDNIEESKFWRRAQHVSEVMADSIPNFCANFLKIGEALFQAANQSSADVMVVTTTAQSIALSISEKLHIPTFVVKFAPDVPTRAFPAPGYEGTRSYKTVWVPNCLFNLVSWYHHWLRIGLATVRCKMGLVEERYRKEILDLPKLEGGVRLREMLECPNLCAFSEVVLPTPRDWPGNCLITGWWLPTSIDSAQSVAPPSPSCSSVSSESVHSSMACCSAAAIPEGHAAITQPMTDEGETIGVDVLEFLGTSKDVICITFGSMSATADAIGLMPLVIDSCERVFGMDVKILIVGARFGKHEKLLGDQSGIASRSEEDLVVVSKARKLRIMVIEEAPYHKLFPLVRLVVHHGRAGTSASTIETCTPSLVIPILLWTDQPLWACQLESIGVGLQVEQRLVLLPEPGESLPAPANLPSRDVLVAHFRRDCVKALTKLGFLSKDPEEQKHRCRVAETVASEHGVVKAANAIEAFVSSAAKC